MGSTSTTPDYGHRLLLHQIEELALTEPNAVVYRAPNSNDISAGFIEITRKTFATAVDRVAWLLEGSLGQRPNFPTIGYMGPSDLRYYAVVAGAAKAGYKSLLCSPRNSLEGQLSLLAATECAIWLAASQMPVANILAARPMTLIALPELTDIYDESPVPRYPYERTLKQAREEPLVLLHTSGSTGLPKPITITQGAACAFDACQALPPSDGRQLQISRWPGRTVYTQMPPFHSAGLTLELMGAAYMGITITLGPAAAPPSAHVLDAMLDHGSCDSLFLAPSTIEDAVRNPAMVEKLSQMEWIGFGGGPLAREAGEELKYKTDLVNSMGTTECGWFPLLETDPEDWIYLVQHPQFGVEMRPYSDGLWQMYFTRNGWPFDDVQWIFHTFPEIEDYTAGDLFSQHPTKSDHWRSEGRADFIIVLSNGEKINPVDMETALALDPLIKSVVIAGQGRFQCCAIVEAAGKAPSSAEEQKEFLDKIWPSIEMVNAVAPGHGAIARSHIAVVEQDTFPRAGKGTVQRIQAIAMLKDFIDDVYRCAEVEAFKDAPKYNFDELLPGIRETVKTITKLENLGDEDDFFSLGVDSLQVVTLQRRIQAGLNEKILSINAQLIYEYPTISKLTDVIRRIITTGDITHSRTLVDEMEAMIEKYSEGLPIASEEKPVSNERHNVILTGSTGSLGSYLLEDLLNKESVDQIWCLNRSEDAEQRQSKENVHRGLRQDFDSRVKFFQANLSKPQLGLRDEDYNELTANVTHIIHNQWQVDFNLSLSSFEPHVRGTRYLIELCHASIYKVSFLFTSSIGVVNNWTSPDTVPERVLTDYSVAGMGYGSSKLVSEVLLAKAGSADHGILNCEICRVGQIAGPIAHNGKGIWNPKEWFPSIIEASAFMGLIPADLGAQSNCDWIPVDILSDIIAELTLSITKQEPQVFHTVNPSSCSWNSLVPGVVSRLSQKTKTKMEVVSFIEWTRALRREAENPSGVDIVPGSKLLPFYEATAGLSGIKAEGEAVLETQQTQSVSKTLKTLGPVNDAWVEQWLTQWGY